MASSKKKATRARAGGKTSSKKTSSPRASDAKRKKAKAAGTARAKAKKKVSKAKTSKASGGRKKAVTTKTSAKAGSKKKSTSQAKGTRRKAAAKKGASRRTSKARVSKPKSKKTISRARVKKAAVKKTPAKKASPKRLTKTKTKARATGTESSSPVVRGLNAIRERLAQQRTEILDLYEQDLRVGQSSNEDGTEDIVDRANNAYNRELTFSISDGEREMLLLIEEAQRRLELGKFGACTHCGTEISEPRLQAIPWARYCIDCQELEEKGLLREY